MAPTPGYTPGHVSVIVRLGGIRHFLAGDAGDTVAVLGAGVVDSVSFLVRVAVHTLIA